MMELYEKLWIVRTEVEERSRAVCTLSGGSAPCTLIPHFQMAK